MLNQKVFTEDILFDYYMPSNSRENTIHSQIPFYLDKTTYNRMVRYSETINKIALRVLRDIINHKKLISYIDDFPCKSRIFNLSCPVSPFLWTRFDTFRDTLGNIKFAEFNYDKPCAQKEIGFSASLSFKGNVNKNFESELILEIKNIFEEFSKEKGIEETTIAFLVDPCHYEELHITYYMKKLLENTNINIITVGPKNLSVEEEQVFAFDSKKVDIILRLFPTEYLHEVNDINEILNCFEKGKVLILNDPRIISIQAKTFFAYLWELVENNSDLLSKEEIEIVKECIPYTTIFTEEKQYEVLKNKDSYVLKASFGRYSGEVYIGSLYTQEEWEKQIRQGLASNKIHILQEVIDIKKEYVYYVNEIGMNIPCVAYGNFGTFILSEKVAGVCVRWSENFLTDNDTTWMCPIGVREKLLRLERYDFSNRKELWNSVIERAMFEYEFTGQFINTNEFVSLNSLVLNKDLFQEIEKVSIKYCEILNKTSKLIQSNFDMFSDLLGIPESLKEVVLNSYTDSFCAVGRIDLVLDNNNVIKILEFNSETPAGLVESIGIQSIIKEELAIAYINPNKNLRDKIKKSFKRILQDFSQRKQIKNIAFLCTSYHEDWFNTTILSNICKELEEYNIVFGNIYDLEVKDEKLFLYGTPLDAIYRYFPLDWFAYEEELKDIIKVLNKQTYSINPTHTLITQSKSIYAVIYELMGKGFYTKEEEEFINTNLPYTTLEPDSRLSVDSLSKPYLSREGKGIVMSYEDFEEEVENVIFQDRVNVTPVEMIKYTTLKSEEKFQFPVIGVYITDDKPSGIFTRVGELITNEFASFVSTFVDN